MQKKASIASYLQKPVRQKLLLDGLCEVMGMRQSVTQSVAGRDSQFSGEILLAEDNPVNQEVALGMLMTLGCDADLAENGAAAVIAASNKRYDLILMDCHMPEMNGFEASRKLRAHEQQQGLPRTPIVALTADIKKGIEVECTEAGMDGYLSKPFSKTRLGELLDQWLSPRASEVSASGAQLPAGIDTTEAVIDSAALDELKSLSEATGRDILGKSVRFFLTQTPEYVSNLRNAADRSDLETLHTLAHSLKSSSANLGALGFSQACAALEASAREESIELCLAQLQSIEALLPGILRELRRQAGIEETVADEDPDAASSAGAIVAPRILVVDDDNGFRLTTCEALKGIGYDVVEAPSGEEAL